MAITMFFHLLPRVDTVLLLLKKGRAIFDKHYNREKVGDNFN